MIVRESACRYLYGDQDSLYRTQGTHFRDMISLSAIVTSSVSNVTGADCFVTRLIFIVIGAASVVARVFFVSKFILFLLWYQIASRHCLTFLSIFKVFRRVFFCSPITLLANFLSWLS